MKVAAELVSHDQHETVGRLMRVHLFCGEADVLIAHFPLFARVVSALTRGTLTLSTLERLVAKQSKGRHKRLCQCSACQLKRPAPSPQGMLFSSSETK